MRAEKAAEGAPVSKWQQTAAITYSGNLPRSAFNLKAAVISYNPRLPFCRKRKGRRNIKAINEQLDPETQAKLNMERERLARIEQRRANTALSPLKGPRGTPRKSVGAPMDEESPEMADEEMDFDEEMGDGNSGRSVIINTSRPEDEDPIFIDPAIAEKLKPHQVSCCVVPATVLYPRFSWACDRSKKWASSLLSRSTMGPIRFLREHQRFLLAGSVLLLSAMQNLVKKGHMLPL